MVSMITLWIIGLIVFVPLLFSIWAIVIVFDSRKGSRRPQLLEPRDVIDANVVFQKSRGVKFSELSISASDVSDVIFRIQQERRNDSAGTRKFKTSSDSGIWTIHTGAHRLSHHYSAPEMPKLRVA